MNLRERKQSTTNLRLRRLRQKEKSNEILLNLFISNKIINDQNLKWVHKFSEDMKEIIDTKNV
jgi:hypothetical protein